jgi:hypothetical protein
VRARWCCNRLLGRLQGAARCQCGNASRIDRGVERGGVQPLGRRERHSSVAARMLLGLGGGLGDVQRKIMFASLLATDIGRRR